ncbi:MAG: Holliday junction branch migration protein RuvA [Gammaproteobacteria bacterium]|nr:MAG: Holliday junction branch migration protein RuvA [Gammaproteobacteria bacterium]
MIGFLRGVLLRKEPPWLLVDVGGVGYELEAPMSTFFELPSPGSEVQLHTQLVVREDQQTLYAFGTEAERRLFRELLKVSGVGAKLALAVLSGISVEGFAACVRNDDKAALIKLPGVGRKTAERLIIEMRDRLGDGAALPAGDGEMAAAPAAAHAEALTALLALGYKPAEARRMLAAVPEDLTSTEDVLRQVLRAAAG